MKLMPGELSFDFLGDGDQKRGDVIPKKIHELIVGDYNQDVRLRPLHVGAKHGEGRLGIFSQPDLLFEGGPGTRTLRRHAVVERHEIFPLGTGFQKNIRRMTRRQRSN
jgi:hypothetical protein